MVKITWPGVPIYDRTKSGIGKFWDEHAIYRETWGKLKNNLERTYAKLKTNLLIIGGLGKCEFYKLSE